MRLAALGPAARGSARRGAGGGEGVRAGRAPRDAESSHAPEGTEAAPWCRRRSSIAYSAGARAAMLTRRRANAAQDGGRAFTLRPRRIARRRACSRADCEFVAHSRYPEDRTRRSRLVTPRLRPPRRSLALMHAVASTAGLASRTPSALSRPGRRPAAPRATSASRVVVASHPRARSLASSRFRHPGPPPRRADRDRRSPPRSIEMSRDVSSRPIARPASASASALSGPAAASSDALFLGLDFGTSGAHARARWIPSAPHRRRALRRGTPIVDGGKGGDGVPEGGWAEAWRAAPCSPPRRARRRGARPRRRGGRRRHLRHDPDGGRRLPRAAGAGADVQRETPRVGRRGRESIAPEGLRALRLVGAVQAPRVVARGRGEGAGPGRASRVGEAPAPRGLGAALLHRARRRQRPQQRVEARVRPRGGRRRVLPRVAHRAAVRRGAPARGVRAGDRDPERGGSNPGGVAVPARRSGPCAVVAGTTDSVPRSSPAARHVRLPEAAVRGAWARASP